jgi:hypothetical protein
VEATPPTDDLKLVYLVELDEPSDPGEEGS